MMPVPPTPDFCLVKKTYFALRMMLGKRLAAILGKRLALRQACIVPI